MEKDKLQHLLFDLFEKQEYWRIEALVDRTEQPKVWLREVLKEIAEEQTSGPNRK